MTTKATFELLKKGDQYAPVAAVQGQGFVAPPACDLHQMAGAFNQTISTLIFGFGSLTVEIEDGKLCEVLARANVRREEVNILDMLFGRFARPGQR